MISNIAYYVFWGKPLVFYLGILALVLFYLTALISFLNTKGIHLIPFKWHPRIAILALVLGTLHGLLALSAYFNL